MKLFAIADLHLDSGGSKPMDVFGAQWAGHFEKISRDWRAKVGPQDLVLIPGDISWAMQLSGALPDLLAIGSLPGMKVLTRGNHDYWWSGISRLRSVLPEGMYAVQNDALRFGGVTVCGTRGWTLPGSQTTAEDQKIFDREVGRLRLSLEAADRLGGLKVAMLHYPPLPENGEKTPLSELLSGHGVSGKTPSTGKRTGSAISAWPAIRSAFPWPRFWTGRTLPRRWRQTPESGNRNPKKHREPMLFLYFQFESGGTEWISGGRSLYSSISSSASSIKRK